MTPHAVNEAHGYRSRMGMGDEVWSYGPAHDVAFDQVVQCGCQKRVMVGPETWKLPKILKQNKRGHVLIALADDTDHDWEDDVEDLWDGVD